MFYHRTWLWVITMNFHLISYDEISNFFWLSQAYEQKTVLSNKSCKRLLGGSSISPNILLENKSNSVPFLPQGKPYWGDFWGRAICFYSFHFSISKGDFLSLSPNAGVVLGWCMIKPPQAWKFANQWDDFVMKLHVGLILPVIELKFETTFKRSCALSIRAWNVCFYTLMS